MICHQAKSKNAFIGHNLITIHTKLNVDILRRSYHSNTTYVTVVWNGLYQANQPHGS